jgi:hypothetical protein
MIGLKFKDLKAGHLYQSETFVTFQRLLVAKKTDEEVWIVTYHEEEQYDPKIEVLRFTKNNTYLGKYYLDLNMDLYMAIEK